MTKKLIDVPVGIPELKKYSTGGTYITYKSREYIYFNSNLTPLIGYLQSLEKLYRNDYVELYISEERGECNCYGNCDCTPSYILYGKRYETDLEYQHRLEKEQKDQEKQLARDRRQLEELKRKFGEV